MSQQEAADQLGVNRVTLSGWENGKPIAEKWVGPLAKLYRASKGWVRYGEGKGPPGYNATEVPIALETMEEGTQPIAEVRAPKKPRKKRRVQGSRTQRLSARPPGPQGPRK